MDQEGRTASIRLRTAGAGDADQVARLHTDSWRRNYRGAYSDLYLDGNLIAERRTVWASRLTTPGHSLTVLAEDDTGLAGFVHVIFDHHPRWGSLLDNLHVSHDHQRSGIGTALLTRAADAVAGRAGGRAMYLWVLEQNIAAQRFYRALGGTCVEQVPLDPPGGIPAHVTGSPDKLRLSWPDAGRLAAPERRPEPDAA